MIVEKMNDITEKLKANNNNKNCLTEYEKDILVFCFGMKVLVEEVEETKSIADKLKCRSKINWMVAEMSKKYPNEAHEFKTYESILSSKD